MNRAALQLELLESRTLLTHAVQFDVSSILNADVAVKYGPGGILPALDSVDKDLGAGVWSFMTQSAANFLAPGNGGLTDSGFVPANSFHPDVQLHYNGFDQNDNARRQEQNTSFQFNVPALTYDQLHFFATAGNGDSTFQVQLTFADGSTAVSPVFDVPDWYTSINESPSAYYLGSGLSRISPNGATFDANNPNHFNIFGFEYDPNSTKVVQSITIQPISVSGTFVFFAATGVTEATYLGASGQTLAAAEGQAVSGNVASFTAVDANAPATEFTATITWGDGQTSPGTVTATGGGNFVVAGNHSYAEAGSDAVSVVIQDATSNATITAASTVDVADAALSATATAITATEGTAFAGSVASFTDDNPLSVASDFTATITWGDGHTSAGTVTANGPGSFQVIGSNTYAEEGSYKVSVALTDLGGSTASTSGTATVADAPLSATGVTVAATEGLALTGAVASFTDGNPNSTASDFTATITWGDGHTSAGTVTANGPGSFQVIGSNTYAEEGSYKVSVALTDLGGSTASTSGTATVADAPLSATGVTVAATEGMAFTGAVASFTDGNPNSTASDFTASITWGDGHTSAGTVTANGPGSFQIEGSNTYAEEGSYSVSVSLVDVGGSTASAAGTATVADAPLTATGATLTATPGTAFTGIVASFTDADPGGNASDYAATISWGDGTSSAGTIAYDSAQQVFTVAGSHTYTGTGSQAVTVVITDDEGNAPAQGDATVTAESTVSLANGPLTIKGSDLSAWTGVGTGKVVVATFSDSGCINAGQGYRARIDWGDSTKPSEGTIVNNHDGTYSVVGQHTYAEEGNYTIHVTIRRAGATVVTGTATATVADSVPIVAVSSVQGKSSRNVYLTVAYADLVRKKHTLLIQWGDGSQSTLDLGTQQYGLGCATHTYAKGQANSAKLVVTVMDDKGTSSAPAALTVQFKTTTLKTALRQATGWDAFYAEVASQLAALFHKQVGS